VAGGPAAFMGHARSGDSGDDAWLGLLRERLEHEVSARTGVDVPVLADRAGAAWADQWRRRVEEGLDADMMLLVIITPDLFGSAACRQEIARFRDRERALGRDDLIVAVYYASAPAMESRIPRRGADLARLLRSRQRADWLAGRMTDVLVADRAGVRTHVVDASRGGRLRSVSEAIRAAKPGDRILVRPGTYEEARLKRRDDRQRRQGNRAR
jgi:hypothetical protein